MSLSLFFLTAVPELLPSPPSTVQIATNAVKPDMVFKGDCNVVQSPDTPLERHEVETGGFWPAQTISWHYENILQRDLDISKARVTVSVGPKHGRLMALDAVKLGYHPNAGPLYRYVPNSGYLGRDEATLLIELNDKSYRTHVKFLVIKKVGDNGYPSGSAAAECEESQPRRVASPVFHQDIGLSKSSDDNAVFAGAWR